MDSQDSPTSPGRDSALRGPRHNRSGAERPIWAARHRLEGTQESGPRVLIPVKPLARAKSRLKAGENGRSELALAFAVDTTVAAATVATVAVVSDDALVRETMSRHSIEVISDGSAPGLNDAVRYAATGLGRSVIAVLTADLPAISAAELAEALRQGMTYPASFVADAEGTGTVLLMGRADRIRPGFGTESADRHRNAGFVELTGDWPGLRRDVDTIDNLREAAALGVGPYTAKLLGGIDGVAEVLSSRVSHVRRGRTHT